MTTMSASSSKVRIRVFVDYWNFQLTMNEREMREKGGKDVRFPVNWQRLGEILAKKGAVTAGLSAADYSYDGVAIYASYNPKTDEGARFKSWATTWLNRQPGIDAKCLPRKTKSLPRCPSCHQWISFCPHTGCGKQISATVEKGVDTLIATDMIRLAWEGAYEIGVLASLDADLIPAVEFLKAKGMKVVQAGFPPGGVDLATACWASFDTYEERDNIFRVVPPK